MSRPKILITNPPWYDAKENRWHGVRAGCRWPFIVEAPKMPENSVGGYNTMPFFMAYAAAYLNAMDAGDVYFYDALARKHTYETFYKTAETIRPDITIIETSTASIDNDLETAKNLKELGSEIALAGPHASAFPGETAKLPYVDYVLMGEYEVNSYEMVLMRRPGVYLSRQLKMLDNLMPYRENDGSIYNYADGFGQDKHIEYPQLQIWTSRGCPWRCRFCLWNEVMTYGRYRTRSAGSVLRELTGCIKNYGFKSVLFDDDTMNGGDRHTDEISGMMRDVDIQWHAMVRADGCSRESFWRMKKAGCVGLKVGVETFSQRGLDYLNKGYDAKQLRETIGFLILAGFKVFLSTMRNIPTETEEDRAETKHWLDHFVKLGASFQEPDCMPLPGTNLYNELNREGKMDNSDWSKYGCFHGEVIKESGRASPPLRNGGPPNTT